MAIFDIFKNKQPAGDVEAKKTQEEIVEAKRTQSKAVEVKKTPGPAKRIEKKQFSGAWKILESPQVTEKAGILADKNNSYIFRVSSAANKNEIKKAIGDLYGVAVERVNIINIPRKARRVGRNKGFKSGFKKAIVKLAEGEKIEIMPR